MEGVEEGEVGALETEGGTYQGGAVAVGTLEELGRYTGEGGVLADERVVDCGSRY